MTFDPTKVGLILFGASKFPASQNFTTSTAFKTSYSRIIDFFTDKNSFGIESHNLLDLFDLDKDPNSIDQDITQYIKDRKETITDLILFYIGHGGYDARNGGYLLAIPTTRDENPGASSILLRSLSTTISRNANGLRTFLIFDSCFSGEAGIVFQSSELLKSQFTNDFPSSGVALLCSSPKDLPSIIVKERNITMFSEGLELALRQGSPSIGGKYLTLRQVREITHDFIKERNPGKDVRPEVHSPRQLAGDIADVPFFRNFGFKEAHDIFERSKLIKKCLVTNDLLNAGKLLQDFVEDFDTLRAYELEVILIASKCNALEDDKAKIERERYNNEKDGLYERIFKMIKSIMR